jgi:hypothetical protein
MGFHAAALSAAMAAVANTHRPAQASSEFLFIL